MLLRWSGALDELRCAADCRYTEYMFNFNDVNREKGLLRSNSVLGGLPSTLDFMFENKVKLLTWTNSDEISSSLVDPIDCAVP